MEFYGLIAVAFILGLVSGLIKAWIKRPRRPAKRTAAPKFAGVELPLQYSLRIVEYDREQNLARVYIAEEHSTRYGDKITRIYSYRPEVVLDFRKMSMEDIPNHSDPGIRACADKIIESIQNEKIEIFWSDAYRYVGKFIEEYDIDSVYELVMNIWETRDKKEYAMELHALLEYAVGSLYKIRATNGRIIETVLQLCDTDISNIDNVMKKVRPDYHPYYMHTVMRKVILLEKLGRIEEAIALCDLATKYDLKDMGYSNFEARKRHLMRKLTVNDCSADDIVIS